MRIGGGRRSGNVEDRRGQTAQSIGIGGGAIAIIARLLFSKTGRRLFVPLAVAAAALWFVVPGGRNILLGLLGMLSGGGMPSATGPSIDQATSDQYTAFAEQVLATTEEVWSDVFRGEGRDYPEPKLVVYTGGTQTGCGFGQAAMGPFYCPRPERAGEPPAVYIDMAFFEQMRTRMGAGGDFAQAYVIAHEVGHHVQNVVGVLDWSMREKQRFGGQGAQANQVQVRVELMADCLAGVWAKRADALPDVELERGDVEEAMTAAAAVGDDALQKKAQGRVVPDSFTHGTSEQRMRWFRTGFETADWNACETREVPYERL